MKILTRLRIGELKEADARWLIRAAQGLHTGEAPEDLLKFEAEGSLQLWSTGNGIIVTRILQHLSGKELVILSMHGRGILKNAENIWLDLKEFAMFNDCRWVFWRTKRKAARAIAKFMHLEPAGTFYLVELKDA